MSDMVKITRSKLESLSSAIRTKLGTDAAELTLPEMIMDIPELGEDYPEPGLYNSLGTFFEFNNKPYTWDYLIQSGQITITNGALYCIPDTPFYNESGTSLVIAKNQGIVAIAREAFGKDSTEATRTGLDPSKLTKITLPKGVVDIERAAFHSLTNVTEYVFPKTLRTIGMRAFGSNYAIKTLDIPDEITSIGTGAFYNCKGLTSFKWPSKCKVIPEMAFNACPALKDVTIPEGVTEIQKMAFNNCVTLERIVLPNSITTIGDNIFRYCRKLKELWLPDNDFTLGFAILTETNGSIETIHCRSTVNVQRLLNGSAKNASNVNFIYYDA